MKTKIKAWILWNWNEGIPFDDGNGKYEIFFDQEISEEHSAMPVIIHLTKEGQKKQIENDLAKQK